jgi:hypothetical protein
MKGKNPKPRLYAKLANETIVSQFTVLYIKNIRHRTKVFLVIVQNTCEKRTLVLERMVLTDMLV